MKIFKSEFSNNYDTYTFSFAEYAISESKEDISTIYSKGFLPFTANISIKYPVFYLARSIRIDTLRFKDSSENRRVDRKSGLTSVDILRIPIEKFDIDDKQFLDFCLNYAEKRFSGNIMSKERFQYILRCGIATDIFEFKVNDKLLGYVLTVLNDDTLHYWFSFFDYALLESFPIGKWMMWKMIKWGKENNINHIYLGTAYGKKALYKIRDFKALEYFDGNSWNDDIKQLKQLCKRDEDKKDNDFFKSLDDSNIFLESILKIQ